MFRFESGLKVYLHREPVDGRKAINGLALLVEQALGLNPFEPAIYVFSNRRRDRIKLLLWDRTGFWLMTKRLEADRFRWPKEAAMVTLTINEKLAQKQNPIQIHLLLPPWLILSALQSPSLEEGPNWHKGQSAVLQQRPTS